MKNILAILIILPGTFSWAQADILNMTMYSDRCQNLMGGWSKTSHKAIDAACSNVKNTFSLSALMSFKIKGYVAARGFTPVSYIEVASKIETSGQALCVFDKLNMSDDDPNPVQVVESCL